MARIKLKYVNAFSNRTGDPSRALLLPASRLQSDPVAGLAGLREFMAAYSAAIAGLPEKPAEIGECRTLPGTINALVVAYYKSDDWNHGLEVETQKTRRRVIEKFRGQHGDKRVALLHREHILKMLAAIEKLPRNGIGSNYPPLLRAAVPSMRKDDPTEGIATVKLPKSKGHHTWTDDEIEQYRAHWPLGT